MTERHHLPDSSVTDQAIRWFVRLHSGDCTETERVQCAKWLAGDDSHQREYHRVAAMWTEMDGLKIGAFPAWGEQTSVGARNTTPSRAFLRLRSSSRSALAIAALLLISFASLWLWDQPVRYATTKGERKTITLSDGSAITLNTDTSLSAQVLPWKRTVRIDYGEALFTIAPDANRPFVVTAGAGTVRVLGTIFNVYKKPSQVVVTVLEGTVEVTTTTVQDVTTQRRLSHGSQLTYTTTGTLLQERQVDAQAVAAWHEGKLVFDVLPLAEVICELARYRAGEIRLADSMLNDVKVSGVFNSDDFDGLLRAIAQMLQVSIQQVGEDVIVLAPAKLQRNSPADVSPYFRVKPLL